MVAAARPRRPHVLGHEITGEVIEKGRDVEYLECGDLVWPFHVACAAAGPVVRATPRLPSRQRRPRGGAYVMSIWVGGSAAGDYVMVPYADFNLLKFPDKAQAMRKESRPDLPFDILPAGFHAPSRQGRASIDGLRRGAPAVGSRRAPPRKFSRRRRAHRRHEQERLPMEKGRLRPVDLTSRSSG